MNELDILGWSPFFEQQVAAFERAAGFPARIASEHRGAWDIWSEHGAERAQPEGPRFVDAEPEATPAVGDWVWCRRQPGGRALVKLLLARRTALIRQAAGRATRAQVVAANIDTILIVTALGGDFRIRRVERYLVPVYESGARPVIVLSKADLSDDAEAVAREVYGRTGVDVHLTTTSRPETIAELTRYAPVGHTVGLVGSSGVGKSTLINALVGHDVMATSDVRDADQKGRHTTTRRQLVYLSGGGLLLDTPGLRELQLWEAAEGLDAAFTDIDELAASCRYADCRHEHEPGCAVQAALSSGSLEPGRLSHYLDLRGQVERQAIRRDKAARRSADKRQGKLYKRIQAQKRQLKAID